MSSPLPADFCGCKLLVAGLPQSPWDRMCELTSHSQKARSKEASLTALCLSSAEKTQECHCIIANVSFPFCENPGMCGVGF